ncbi:MULTISPECIES: branched-chain amino acid ABC transporter ATP-binding protein/permease [Actibacterium]|uniref:Branched-chain amino acid transport system permease protein n=1 Tax=Actibacterium naphthalenivorans TaxID=1614693 RepID=A0A840CL65_9RHOB|nr:MULTISPECIES: branched-chain amino acid ABC transporter ATP-binding protein/permease [Actibacterium]ALG91379.1 hypothetical protein TQ29_15770 [Actibacterium sp. EMB200-NS6]MBB4022797.1 branched-chain amino acid transport system permease protein [Actibacterium naphthalenivorans]
MTIADQEPIKMDARASSYMAVTGVAIAVLLALPLFLTSFNILLLNMVGIFAMATLGLVLLTGSGGVTSFAQAAFMGLGAYTSAYVTLRLGLSPWLGLAAALALVFVVTMAIGYVTLHLGGHYLPITTLAWAVAIHMLFGTLDGLGAHSGIGGLPPISIAGVAMDRPERAFYMIWVTLILFLFAASNLLRSRQGRAIAALRGGSLLAEALGISAFRTRMMLFVLAGELACVGGWLFAHTQNFISPSSFDLTNGLNILLMSVLGGVGSVLGALVGAGAVMVGRNLIQDVLPMLALDAGSLEIVVFGAIFIVLVQYSPKGLSPLLSRWLPPRPAPALPDIKHDEVLRFGRAKEHNDDAVILSVDGLEKRFGGLVAVKDLSFDVHRGTIHALIGPNGAGKSTTFDMISGLQSPTSGTVQFNGTVVTHTPARNMIARGMARTFQHVRIRPQMTLLDNVMQGAHWRLTSGFWAGILRLDRAEEAAYRKTALLALKAVGLADQALVEAGTLSLGQQRQLEIARALAADPEILLLDEPAAGLRTGEKAELAALLSRLREAGMTILLVEHDMDFVMGLVDRIVVLDFGQHLAEGLPDEIRQNSKVQEAYLGGLD